MGHTALLHPATFGHRDRRAITDDEVVQQSHLDQCEGLLELSREMPISRTRLGHAARMIVGNDDSSGVDGHGALDDHARMNGSAVDTAFKQHLLGDDAMAAIEKERGEALKGRGAQPTAKILAGLLRRGQCIATGQLGLQVAMAQCEGRRNQGRARRPNVGQAGQLARWSIEHGSQPAAAVDEGLCVGHGVTALRACAEEQRQQLGVGKRLDAEGVQAFAGTVGIGPVAETHGGQSDAIRHLPPSEFTLCCGKLPPRCLSGHGVSELHGERVLLGVTGGIAAYKSAELVRRLREAGAEVRVVMTAGAGHFITEATLQALSGNLVRSSLWDPAAEAAMGHIELARWASRVLIAPATADFLARLAQGRADELLSTLCLATEAPIAVAPAMNRVMWAHPATQANMAVLAQRGVLVFGPASGEQACGELGEGRMREPTDLVADLAAFISAAGAVGRLAGCRVLVSAGPTYEDIDPVRFLGNRSSGRMGFAIAEAAARAGAEVTLVAGPVKLPTPVGVARIDVRSAAQMHAAVLAALPAQDVYVGAAAVADYRASEVASQKLKKGAGPLHLMLERTADVLADVAAHPCRPRCVLGFAAETHDIESYARGKLAAKNLDAIAANRVGVPGCGFDADENALMLYWNGGERLFPTASKAEIARGLVVWMADWLARA